MLKDLLRRPGATAGLGGAMAGYLRLVRRTSGLVLDPPDLYERIEPDLPVIIAMWHGEHFLMPFLKRPQDHVKVLISRHRDGEINAVAAERLGLGLIRGSGSHGGQNVGKRGAAALIEMLRALDAGFVVATTADVPKVARVAGMGIVTLARKSGRPIYPVAVVTSRHRAVRSSWDQSKIPLPFGRIAITYGGPVRVAPDADGATMEAARKAVEAGLDDANRRAYARAAQS